MGGMRGLGWAVWLQSVSGPGKLLWEDSEACPQLEEIRPDGCILLAAYACARFTARPSVQTGEPKTDPSMLFPHHHLPLVSRRRRGWWGLAEFSLDREGRATSACSGCCRPGGNGKASVSPQWGCERPPLLPAQSLRLQPADAPHVHLCGHRW